MNVLRHSARWWSALLLGLVLCGRAEGQEGVPGANTNTPPAYLKSPVQFFRELLAMSAADQAKFLEKRSAQDRKRIEAKLEEYASLDADQRELRLQATELHWYLSPLLKSSREEQARRLGQIPPEMRKLVEERLDLWRILPPPLTEELIEYERVMEFFAQPGSGAKAQRERVLATLPSRGRTQLEAGISRWQAMPESQRQLLLNHFNQFFDLNEQEKEKALRTLSDSERQQMDRTLQEFEKLPRNQRTLCIQSFQRFTSMSLPERELFLRNAELWKDLSPEERKAWRDLVKEVPDWPPLPFPPGTAEP
jgi:hypothetical protein